MLRPRGRSGPESQPEAGFYEHIRQGYDRLAPSYDDEIGTNAIGLRMRDVFRKALMSVLHPGDFVFEIGCGTGLEALWLARQGLEVIATDISGEMLAQLSEKTRAEGLSERVRTRRLAAREIGSLGIDFGQESFDGGYSHAGALNMEPDIRSVPRQVAALLRRRGPFVFSVINKTSLFEVLFYPMVLKPRKAFRRLGNVVPIPISRREPLNRHVIPTRFYTPREILALFGDGFEVRTVQGLQVFLPPANLTDVYSVLRPLFVPLEIVEGRLSTHKPVNSWGHHTILTLRRR